MFIVCIILFIFLFIIIYWIYVRPRQYIKIYQKLLKFEGFKYSHLSGKEREHELTQPVSNTKSHMLIYGSSGSGKTSF